MSVLFTPRKTAVRSTRPIAGYFVAFLALVFFWATIYAATVPRWTEPGLRSELDRVFQPGVHRIDVEGWLEEHHATWSPEKNDSEVHGVIYAGPIADREKKTFRVKISFNDAGRATRYELEVCES